MGKEEEEKGARLVQKDYSSGKAALLEPSNSVRGDPRSQQDHVTGDTSSEECEDFHYDTEEMDQFLETIKGMKDDPQCMDCQHGATAENMSLQGTKPRFMMCLGCSQCFCAGSCSHCFSSGLVINEDVPTGHAQTHAKSACHPVALWIDQPNVAYCFHCDHSLSLRPIFLAAHSRKHGYVVRGMPNCRAKCYVNALVQCLLGLDDLCMAMLGTHYPEGSLGVALKDLFLETRAGNDVDATLNTDKLLESICKLDKQCMTSNHQDCNEFLGHLCNCLIEEELLKRPPDVPKDGLTVVDSIFTCEVSIIWRYKPCLHTSGTKAAFDVLTLSLTPKEHPTKSVPAPQIRKEEEEKKPSIKQCLEYEFRKEVEKRCERCKPSTSRSKQVGKDPSKQIHMGGTADEITLLSKLPPVLTIYVLRFMRMGHVEFEENIDLQEYLEPRSAHKDNARYRLVGVIERLWRSVNEAHFVAYVRGCRIVNEQASWFRASDTSITEISLDEVLKCEAFLLFYEKIEACDMYGSMPK